LIINAVGWVGRRIANALRSNPQINGPSAATGQQG